jgi:hypothetical protein
MIKNTVLRSIAVFAVLFALTLGAVPAPANAAAATKAPAAVYGKVTKITTTTIFLKGTYLDRSVMTWQVTTNMRTKYYNSKDKPMKRSSIRVGHNVTAIGNIVNHTFRIVDVTEIDDWNRK